MAPEKRHWKRILLIGLPNTGKSTLFRRLVHRGGRVSAFPDSTAEVQRGNLRLEGQEVEIVDMPGIYGLSTNADSEKVARSLLVEEAPDLVIQVADAKNLKRSLVLTALLAEFRLPMILVANMADEAAQKGIRIRRQRLEAALGIPVIETVAAEGIGTAALLSALPQRKAPSLRSRLPDKIGKSVEDLAGLMASPAMPAGARRGLALLALTGDEETSRWTLQKAEIQDYSAARQIIEETGRPFYRPLSLVCSLAHEGWAESLARDSAEQSPVSSTPWLNRLGDMALTPVAGSLTLFLVLALLYFAIGRLAAGLLVDLLVNRFFGEGVSPLLERLAEGIPWAFLQEIALGPYGLYPMAIVPVLGLVLPVVTFFYFSFGMIEDSGYISRLSVLLDRLFRRVGLNGKAVLPIMLGFSCVTTATMSTRVLDSRRERFIAIFLLSLGVPCSAKLSLILVILARVGFAAFLTVFGVVFLLTVLAGVMLNRWMPAEPSHFLMEIPAIRIPSLKNVLQRTFYRSWIFLRESLPLFLISALGLFSLAKIGFLSWAEELAAPVIRGGLGLPPQFAESLLMGFIRGEAGIAVLSRMVDSGVMDHRQLVVAMIVTILFAPCVTNFMLIVKELGTRKALAILALVTAAALSTGVVMNFLLHWGRFEF